jgi:L-asparagine transporter-like permease
MAAGADDSARGDAARQAGAIVAAESGLARELEPRHLAMIALGGAIGTGLFLGSALAVQTAGPAVILTYALCALLVLVLSGALAEMAVAHPTPGAFGVHAEAYVSRWAGFVVRYTFWFAQAIVIGGDAIAVAIYCGWWFPDVPQWAWIVGFATLLVGVNARSVGQFGTLEYWFAMIKVVAIVCFIGFGTLLLTGFVPGSTAAGLSNLTAHGGFFATGLAGVWLASSFVVFGFVGTEVVAVTAGEARDPARAVPRALRTVALRLAVFYVGAVFVLVALAPWNATQAGGIDASPFVRVFEQIGVPAAAQVVNFVVVTAALSSMNCNLYTATRMLYSLSRGGYAPAALGRVSARGVPLASLAVTASGLALAAGMAVAFPSGAYVYMLGIALFGGLFVWFMCFVTHLRFRAHWRAAGRALPFRAWAHPATSVLGAAVVLAILATTWWVPRMQVTLLVGLPWLLALSLVYLLWFRRKSA